MHPKGICPVLKKCIIQGITQICETKIRNELQHFGKCLQK